MKKPNLGLSRNILKSLEKAGKLWDLAAEEAE